MWGAQFGVWVYFSLAFSLFSAKVALNGCGDFRSTVNCSQKHSTKSYKSGRECVFVMRGSHGGERPLLPMMMKTCNTGLSHGQRPTMAISCSTNHMLPMRLTFTDGTDASPGAIVPTNTRGRTNKMVALWTSKMDLMSYKILWAKLGSMSGGFQRGAGGGSCGRKESMRRRLVTCGVSLPTSSGILCLGIYTCHRQCRAFMGKDGSDASFTVNQHTSGCLYVSQLHQQPNVMLCCILWKV